MTALISVHGMRRSGNHAIIGWLRRNLSGPSVFLNDCALGDPFETFALMETPERTLHGAQFRRTRWFPQFPAARAIRSHIVSYEDKTPDETGAPAGWGDEVDRRGVVIHRGFLDWLASYFVLVTRRQPNTAWGVTHPREIRPAIAIYGRLLAAARYRVGISFDLWRRDARYRLSRLTRLGLPARDDDLGTEERYGGGSSFAADAPGERWRALAGDAAYRDLARDAARDAALMTGLSYVYPRDAARLARLDRTGSFDLEERPWFS